MWFKLTGTNDLSNDDIIKLKENGFNIEFRKIDEQKETYWNTSFKIIEEYNLFINITTLTDLTLICNLLEHNLIICKPYNSNEYNCLEIYNGYRE